MADIDEGGSLAKTYDDADLAREPIGKAKGLEDDIRAYELLKQKAEADRAYGEKGDVSWGDRIED